ncbi:hypothetical protein ABIB88_005712, partial [Bradyrhizobium sp. JR19.8]
HPPARPNQILYISLTELDRPRAADAGAPPPPPPPHDSGAWSYPARCLSYAFRCVYAMRSFGTGTLAASARAMRSPTT